MQSCTIIIGIIAISIRNMMVTISNWTKLLTTHMRSITVYIFSISKITNNIEIAQVVVKLVELYLVNLVLVCYEFFGEAVNDTLPGYWF